MGSVTIPKSAQDSTAGGTEVDRPGMLVDAEIDDVPAASPPGSAAAAPWPTWACAWS